MKLFAIRKERGELLILCAENQPEAVKRAGLDMEAVGSVVRQLRDHGTQIDPQTVIRGGIGPQFYEVQELADLCLEFRLDNTGEFELSEMDIGTRETIHEMYPIINAATETAIVTWPGPLLDEEERIALAEFMCRAVQEERRRFGPTSVTSMQ